MNLDESKEFVRNILEELSCVPVIYEKQNAPRPKLPYIGLQVISSIKKGFDNKEHLDGEITYSGERNVSLDLQYYGQNGMTALGTLRNKLETETVTDRCFAEGISFYDFGDVTDITELLDSQKWENRAQLDVFYCYPEIYTGEAGYFDKVQVIEESPSLDGYEEIWIGKEENE